MKRTQKIARSDKGKSVTSEIKQAQRRAERRELKRQLEKQELFDRTSLRRRYWGWSD